jgi:NTP pyrophosphatase (non-canonical NTP hydrolase)
MQQIKVVSMDGEINVNELREAVRKFVTERNWDHYHTPKNLAMSIAIEAAELMEHFQWLSSEQSINSITDKNARSQIVDELADILIYCLSFVNRLDIDISDAIYDKLYHNEERYPIGYMPTEE